MTRRLKADQQQSELLTIEKKVQLILAKLARELSIPLPAPTRQQLGFSRLGTPERDVMFLEWKGEEMMIEIVSDKVTEPFFTVIAQAFERDEDFCYESIHLEKEMPEKIRKLLSKYR